MSIFNIVIAIQLYANKCNTNVGKDKLAIYLRKQKQNGLQLQSVSHI